MQVKKKSLDDIRPYHRNPRENEKTVAELKDSIKKYGFNAPIMIGNDGDIVTGHARYKAALELKGELDNRIKEARENDNDELAENLKVINNGQIFFIPADTMTEEQSQEYRIVDNKIQEHTSWDKTELKFELREIGDDEIPGFNPDELEALLDSDVELDVSDEDMEESKAELDKYEEQAEDELERKIEVRCPHCQEKVILDKDQLERRYF